MSADKKIILVTGASRGIGAEIALLAGERGWRVGVNYHRSAEAANHVVEQVRRSGGEAVALQADVGKLAEVQRMFRELDEAFGTLDVLVNNAGVLANFRITDVDEDNVRELYEANVFSAYYCAREAVRRMATSRGGRGGAIVNMSSVASRLGGLAGGTAYAGSKGALDSFNLSLAKELGPEGIRVNALRPGLIATDIHAIHGGVAHAQELAKTAVPMGRTGSAREVAEAALWLATEQASYVHGAVLDVAGGR
ncbi:SDR family oxidoreductase [Ramlibacter ginsenosidimutans]|uniref:SDR family oxidoreductase n=1 Tax=Ramlibacter ginsenosidimutans TaxID=502333 RepID=A0A934TRI9_9BURK|nr:SDR family oxidoreductase [Ramlibacter ginsenosidimutans]MBK6005626.1 SDR family oxidoreductase [Ramlibacter ginsenosidimutans]